MAVNVSYQKKVFSYNELKDKIVVFMGYREQKEKEYKSALSVAMNEGYTKDILEKKKQELNTRFLKEVDNIKADLLDEIEEITSRKQEELERKVKEPMKSDYYRLLSGISNRKDVTIEELSLIRDAVSDSYGASQWADEISLSKGFYVKKSPNYTEMKLNINNIAALLKAMVLGSTKKAQRFVINGVPWSTSSEYDRDCFQASDNVKWNLSVNGLENGPLFPSGGIYKLILGDEDKALLEEQLAQNPEDSKREIINNLFATSDYFKNVISLSDEYMQLLTPINNEKARAIAEELSALAD